ncbi:MAG TPA: hypothetical protein VLA77_03370 [Candidatus Saccharimonadales bacterium]|nr:hypothetical protein [Candidatus Saccharimonadales bacterium]
MQEEKNMDNCGCDCEMCKQGRHHECPTGKCTWKDADKDEDEEDE